MPLNQAKLTIISYRLVLRTENRIGSMIKKSNSSKQIIIGCDHDHHSILKVLNKFHSQRQILNPTEIEHALKDSQNLDQRIQVCPLQAWYTFGPC